MTRCGGQSRWYLTASSALAGFCSAAAAQVPIDATGEAETPDIVVTAQRRSQSLLSVPLAVTALTGDSLSQRRITDPTALGTTVPNLQVNDQTGGNQPNFTLRGIGLGNEFSDNQLSPIGFYIDDAYVVSRGSQGGQLFDLERVEVLRGPQGTLYGRNTTGGAINIITRKPALSDSNGYAEIGYGNYNDLRSQAALELTPVDGVLGIRLSGDFSRHEGYVKNIFPGQPDVQSGNTLSGRLAVRFNPSESLDVNLRLFTQRSRNWQPANYTIGTEPDGTNPITGYNRGSLGFFETDTELPLYFRTNAKGVQLTVRYKLSDAVSIQSLTYYDKAFLGLPQEADGSPMNLILTYFNSWAAAFNQELRLSYESDRLKLQGGVYYGWDRIRVDNRYLLFGFLEDLGVPTDPNLVAGGASILQNYKQVRRSKAIFGQGDYKVTDSVTVTLGLRYTHDTGRYAGTAFIGDYDYQPLVQTIGTPAGPVLNSGNNSAFTGRAALEYSLPRGGIVYASYSRGYRAGSFNGGAYIDPAQIDYIKPERVNAYEAGVKTKMFDGSTTLAAAGFYYDYSNQQLSEVRGVAIFLENAGASTIKGLEMELTSRLAPTFSLRASGGLLSAKYDTLVLDGLDLKGNRLPFAPKFTASMGFDWGFYNSNDWSATFSPTVNITSKTHFSPKNGLGNYGLVRDDGHTLVDASLIVENGPWRITIWGRNLTQSKYFVSGNNLQDFGFVNLFQGSPRTVGALIRRSF
jgi:iron complex outermembrane recepter protein